MWHFGCLASAEGEALPGIIAIAAWISFALIVAGIAQGKNRSGMAWFWLGVLAGPLALLYLVLFGDKLPSPVGPLPSETSPLSSILPPIPLDKDGFAPEGTPIPDEDDDEDSPKT
jgi:hypothetical protein